MSSQKRVRICFCVSVAVMLIALVMALSGTGINFGIDSAGSLNIRYDMGGEFAQADVEAVLKDRGIAEYSIARTGENGEFLRVRMPKPADEEAGKALQDGLQAALLAKFPAMNTEETKVSDVSPVKGVGAVGDVVICVVALCVLVLAYVGLRFGLSYGLTVLIGVLHDVLLVISLMVILRGMIPVGNAFGAIVLAVAVYSAMNTYMLLSSIRTNRKEQGSGKMLPAEVAELASKQNRVRTIHTALVMLLVTTALCVLGTAEVRAIGLPVVLGILISIYSTNLMNGQVWACLEEKYKSRKKTKAKAKKA